MERNKHSKYLNLQQASEIVGSQDLLLTLLTDGELEAEGRYFYIDQDENFPTGPYTRILATCWEDYIENDDVHGPPFTKDSILDTDKLEGVRSIRILKSDLRQVMKSPTPSITKKGPGRLKNSGAIYRPDCFQVLDTLPDKHFSEKTNISEICRLIREKPCEIRKTDHNGVPINSFTINTWPGDTVLREIIEEYITKGRRGQNLK